jgi:palmitoyltransferase
MDTSVFSSNETMTAARFKNDPSAKDWNLCEKCELIVPPRSWHCDICNVCILKRDHHCMFASNCVGYRNHRHFLVFLLYFFIGTTYSFCYNSYYLWIVNGSLFIQWVTPLKMVFPMFMFMFSAPADLHLFLYMLILIGAVFTGVLIIYHARLIIKNATTHEKHRGTYDLGLTENLKIVFGDNWMACILWPFAKSTLPEVYWNAAESQKSK